MRGPFLVAYGAAHFGKSLMWNSSTLLFAFYLTEVVGLAPGEMSAVVGGSLALNACLDLVLGRLIGRRVQSLASAGALQSFGAALAGLAFVGFATTALFPTSVRVGIAVATLFAFRIGYSVIDVPQNSMMSFAATSDAERSKIAAIRYIAAGVSLIAIALLFKPWLRGGWESQRALVFPCVAVGLAATAQVTALILKRQSRMTSPAAPTPAALALAVPNGSPAPPFVAILASIIVYSGLTSIFGKLEAYFVGFALEIGRENYFMAAVALGQATSQFGWRRLGERCGLEAVFGVSAVAVIIAAIAFIVVGGIGGWATLGSGFVYGGCASGLLMSIWALLAKSAGVDPKTTTQKFGAFTFCSKMSQAVSLLWVGRFLAGTEYRSPAGRDKLVMTMGAAPAVTGVLCLVVLILMMLHRHGRKSRGLRVALARPLSRDEPAQNHARDSHPIHERALYSPSKTNVD